MDEEFEKNFQTTDEVDHIEASDFASAFKIEDDAFHEPSGLVRDASQPNFKSFQPTQMDLDDALDLSQPSVKSGFSNIGLSSLSSNKVPPTGPVQAEHINTSCTKEPVEFIPYHFGSLPGVFDMATSFVEARRKELEALDCRSVAAKYVTGNNLTVWHGQTAIDAVISSEMISQHMMYPYDDYPQNSLHEAVVLAVCASLGHPFALLTVATVMSAHDTGVLDQVACLRKQAKAIISATPVQWDVESNLYPRVVANTLDWHELLRRLNAQHEYHHQFSSMFMDFVAERLNRLSLKDPAIRKALDTFASTQHRCSYLFARSCLRNDKVADLENAAPTNRAACQMLYDLASSDVDAREYWVDALSMYHRLPFALCESIEYRFSKLNSFSPSASSDDAVRLREEIMACIDQLQKVWDPRARVYEQILREPNCTYAALCKLSSLVTAMPSFLSQRLDPDDMANHNATNIAAFFGCVVKALPWQFCPSRN